MNRIWLDLTNEQGAFKTFQDTLQEQLLILKLLLESYDGILLLIL
jgi:hypothetical protein